MQIPLIEGRTFNDGDTADSAPVAIVDRYLVEKYFKDKSAIGQEIQRGGPDSPKIRIVGVVGTINSIDLGQPVTKERIYRPVHAAAELREWRSSSRRAWSRRSWCRQVRSAVSQINPEQPIFDVRTMEQWMVAFARGPAHADGTACDLRRRRTGPRRRSASTACSHTA